MDFSHSACDSFSEAEGERLLDLRQCKISDVDGERTKSPIEALNFYVSMYLV